MLEGSLFYNYLYLTKTDYITAIVNIACYIINFLAHHKNYYSQYRYLHIKSCRYHYSRPKMAII